MRSSSLSSSSISSSAVANELLLYRPHRDFWIGSSFSSVRIQQPHFVFFFNSFCVESSNSQRHFEQLHC